MFRGRWQDGLNERRPGLLPAFCVYRVEIGGPSEVLQSPPVPWESDSFEIVWSGRLDLNQRPSVPNRVVVLAWALAGRPCHLP